MRRGTGVQSVFRVQMGLRLHQLRLESGWTLRDLAAEVGCTNVVLCRYEHGQSSPGAYHLLLLAQILGVSADWLLTGTE